MPDGLVKSRINHFSAMVPKLGEEVMNILAVSTGCTSGRKRKLEVDQETSTAE